jgi:hypothetical protein
MDQYVREEMMLNCHAGSLKKKSRKIFAKVFLNCP